MAQTKLEDPESAVDDALYCQEEYSFDSNDNESDDIYMINNTTSNDNINNDNDNVSDDYKVRTPLSDESVLDLWWDEEELTNLLSKEAENESILQAGKWDSSLLGLGRKEAVDWMLKVNANYSFSVITALLAVNCFDRFMVRFEFHKDNKQQWMTQLVAVACLSLAAKVEETFVPSLLDFQVEESKYVFEAKTIQRMELLVLSHLQWKMNPVTSYSFLDYLIRRIPLKGFIRREVINRGERILLFTIRDIRFNGYLPSVMASAIILHVINDFQPCIGDEYQNLLFGLRGIDKEKVLECCQLILESAAESNYLQSNKRKSVSRPGSPNGVIDVSFSSDSSNDSWAVASASSSPEPLAKKICLAEGRPLERFSHSSVNSLRIQR